MEPNSNDSSPGRPASTGQGFVSPPSSSKGVTMTPLSLDFDLPSVRCGVESRLHDAMWGNEDLVCRMRAIAQEREAARVQTRLELMTDGYRVDEAITPKLFHLGRMITQILRLVQPLDLFIWPTHQPNAFCLPSRKGNRLVMCMTSALVASLGSQELLFVMGHEVGHTLLKHGETLGIDFDNPHFSPLEVVRIRSLERAQEISCDRVGLLACQDVRVASATLFKIASGLTERWISFDETAYSRHFDELSSMAEVIDLEAATRTHPFVPLRVKAMIAFAKSDVYARAFGRSDGSISAGESDRGLETMLSVLAPDLSELEGAKEEEAFCQFVIDGALTIIAADGVVQPEEVAWLKRVTEREWSIEDLAANLSNPEFRQRLDERLEMSAHVLRNKLPEQKRAGLMYAMCELALSAGGIPEPEFGVLDGLRQKLRIRAEIARDVLQAAQKGQ